MELLLMSKFKIRTEFTLLIWIIDFENTKWLEYAEHKLMCLRIIQT